MFYVYILRSEEFPKQIYKGFSTDLKERLRRHNAGESLYTNKYRPWKLIFYAAFENKETAKNFEKYLKSASGIAFLRKRLIKLSSGDISEKKYKSIKKKLLR
ncbi:MAG: GIY-YIG nuclease family protein [Candidatus Parcubacteria bacterium]|nr:GIY-YIG nuclease family protein [Candidatus Parcubacteria bacterium]